MRFGNREIEVKNLTRKQRLVTKTLHTLKSLLEFSHLVVGAGPCARRLSRLVNTNSKIQCPI